MRGVQLLLLTTLVGLVAGQAADGDAKQLLGRHPLSTRVVGDSFDNPIDLGSAASVSQDGDTTGFPDSALSGCNYPDDYPTPYKGDGGDIYYRWKAPFTGSLAASACSDTFPASLTALGNGTEFGGEPIVNGNLGCGGGFDSCSDPNLQAYDYQLLLDVTAGQEIVFTVTGVNSSDYGPFKLNLQLSLSGSSIATAVYLDSEPNVTVSGNSQTYPETYNSSCNGNSTDGPDVFYSYTTVSAGVLMAKACSAGFNATVTILAESTVLGAPETPVACGTCANPAKVNVAAGKFFFIVVSGSRAGDAGAFQLSVMNMNMNGTSYTNPIDIGSPAKLSRAGDSSLYADSALSGCNYPDFYPTPDRGDGGDVYFRWRAPFTGILTASACSDKFQASLTALGNGTDAEDLPVVNGNLGCGGGFDSCSDPNLKNFDYQLLLDVTAGQVIVFAVTGTEAADSGPFRLNLDLLRPGSSIATADFLDSKKPVNVDGNTRGYPQTFASPCNAGKADGPDIWYGYSSSSAGLLTVKACGSAGFNATVTILAEATELGGNPTALACGTCAKPARVTVDSGKFFFFVVSGTKSSTSGAFKLTAAATNGTRVGSSMATPIVLGSPAKLSRSGDSSNFVDNALGSCNYPDFYPTPNKGDGGDVYFRWTAPFAGFLTASACSDSFQASLTALGNGTDAEDLPVVNGNLGCGGVFNGCKDPNLQNFDYQLILEVSKGQSVVMAVTGTEAGDYGPFKLNLELSRPGSTIATADFLNLKSTLTVSGNTKGNLDTYASSCNGRKPDGPDMYYSFSSPVNGTITAKACGTGRFNATVTIMAEATKLGGKPIPMACGTCAKPAVVRKVPAKGFYYVVVSGSKSAESGPFQLTLTAAKA